MNVYSNIRLGKSGLYIDNAKTGTDFASTVKPLKAKRLNPDRGGWLYLANYMAVTIP